MPLELVTIPCLADNYAYLLHDADSGQTALVDAPEPGPILAALNAHQWRLTHILITHHHGDHTDAVDAIRQRTHARVYGAAADALRLPRLDETLAEGSRFRIGTEEVQVIEVPGHTVGHIAYLMPASGYAFTADSLMSGGCGRLFEGTARQMHDSLAKLAALPPETLICSGHEYTASNLRFAQTLEPDNPKLISRIAEVAAHRAQGRPTVPVPLRVELETNPYLRAHLPALKMAVGRAEADDVTVFAEIRARKDKF
ncbi:hydroxyacylglutathione hydrolase [Tabrizicola sp.]|uniref:hydroxyacylglutathione hydrolase n=1 Tax=Tabrizicola sp. TaxID=2005166 RepID=UPI003F3581F1